MARIGPLDTKLLRDLWRMKWQTLAIALLIATGVGVTVMSYSSQEALRTARDAYYRDARFADVFVTLKRAPLSLARRAATLEGVTAADARIVHGGLSAIPGLTRPATIQLVSLPENETVALNRVVITRGRAPSPGRTNEALALKTFVDAANIALGDRVRVTVAGRVLTFTIVGAAISPEFIYLPSAASIMPDDAHTGVLWARRESLEGATRMVGAFNALALTLAAGAPRQDVDRRLESMFGPYGARPILFRDDQPSHAFLEGEFRELSLSGAIFPPIFILVAAGLVHMVMMRLVEVEREQIGLLKAFGYTNGEAARPYALLALLVGLVGIAIGAAFGIFLARAITALYGQYMRFPVLEPRFHFAAFALSGCAGLGAALAGALLAVRNAIRLSPAVALSPPHPTRFQPAVLERLAPRLGVMSRLIARNLERRPVRAGLTVLGLAASIALLLGTQFLFGAIDKVMDHAFYRRQRMTHQVTFVEPRGVDAIADARRLPGVMVARAVRTADATLSNGVRSDRVSLTGLDDVDPLLRPLDTSEHPIPLRGDGLILTDALARKLRLKPGDVVHVRLNEGRRQRLALPVVALAMEYSGLSAYLDRRSLNRLLGEGDVVSAAQLIVDSKATPAFYRAVSASPGIAGAMSRDDTVQSYRKIIAEAFRTSRIYYALFAAVIAFGVAYNAGRIAFSERARDLATLEVLGFTHGEIASIQLGEQALLAILALPVGIVAGGFLAQGIAMAYQRDEMRIPAVIDAGAIGMTLAVYFATVAVTLLIIGYRLWRLDLVAVLKTRE
jgi:putative ABC transport system permease protein